MEEIEIPSSNTIVSLHDLSTGAWHLPQQATGTPPRGVLEVMILAQHRENFDLWHQEDEARNPDAKPELISEVKHAIDRLNQRRNDLVEQVDARLSESLSQHPEAPLHSETPGMMIDRLSIMALKVFHTREETERESAGEAHRAKNLSRLAVLMEQRTDLAHCFDELIADIRAGRKRFKLYRQMKMYNDPELNPVLYRQGAK